MSRRTLIRLTAGEIRRAAEILEHYPADTTIEVWRRDRNFPNFDGRTSVAMIHPFGDEATLELGADKVKR